MNEILGYDRDKIYMVHVTDYFPRNHRILSTYDGNKIYDVNRYGEKIKIYMGDEAKDVVVPSHRHTVHFTLNSVVENAKDGAGNWDEVPMAIVEPMSQHEAQFLSYGNGDSFAWGSVELSNDAILFIKRENLELIPKEEQGKWKIVVCNEEIAQEVKKFFRENGIPQIEYVDHAGHQMSVEYSLESNLMDRDHAINYVKNNTFDGKSDIKFSNKEFFEIMSILQDPKNNIPIAIRTSLSEIIGKCSNPKEFSIFRKCEHGYLPSKIIEEIIASGFYLAENGDIKLKSDQEIYEILKQLENLPQKEENHSEYQALAENILHEAQELYVKYMEFLCSKPMEDTKEFEKEIIQQTVQEIRAKQHDELSESEKAIISFYEKRILGTKVSELSEDEVEIAKKMKPGFIDVNDKYSIATTYLADGRVKVDIGGQQTDDYQNLLEKFQRVSGISFDEILELCQVELDGRQDNETFGEFYSRIQSVIDAFSEIVTSEKESGERFEFSSMGVHDRRKESVLLASAIEATCETTSISQINKQVIQIREQKRARDEQQTIIEQ